MRHRPNQGGPRSAVLKRGHEKVGSNMIKSLDFNHLTDQRQQQATARTEIELKKRSFFEVSDFEGANDVFFLKLESKLCSCRQFSFQRQLRLVPVDSNVNQT